jgi:hypothetical protein
VAGVRLRRERRLTRISSVSYRWEKQVAYPNVEYWSALREGNHVSDDDEVFVLSLVDCGSLLLPAGRLVACDPFAGLQRGNNPYVPVPPGCYRVVVTLADVSGRGDGSHMREAYATLILDEAAVEIKRRIITPSDGLPPPPPEMTNGNTYRGFPVDAGTACFVDDGAVEVAMPDGSRWYEDLFENESPDCWFARMDDPGHIRGGIANIALPLGKNGENIVIFHSGWGDGFYPVVGGYDASDRLIRVHIDFWVISPPETS